jgi:hypothetical protein
MKLNHQYHDERGTQQRKGWEKRGYTKLVHDKNCARCEQERATARKRREA